MLKERCTIFKFNPLRRISIIKNTWMITTLFDYQKQNLLKMFSPVPPATSLHSLCFLLHPLRLNLLRMTGFLQWKYAIKQFPQSMFIELLTEIKLIKFWKPIKYETVEEHEEMAFTGGDTSVSTLQLLWYSSSFWIFTKFR